MRKVILASASPARLQLLRLAGLDPEAVPAGINEHAITSSSVQGRVEKLAASKAAKVAKEVRVGLIIGCDSMLELRGKGLGKPGSPAEAVEWWLAMRGNSGVFYTGHCVIDAATGDTASAVASTVVHFGSPSDEEISAYARSGESQAAAGGFAIQGMGGCFIEGVVGCPGNVAGLSLPLLRELLGRIGVSILDLGCR